MQTPSQILVEGTPYIHVPRPRLTATSGKSRGKGIREVTYPVSYTYNGGVVVQGEWYAGYQVLDPIIPEGARLVSIGVGLQLNARPPYATQLLYLKIPQKAHNETSH